MLTRLVPLLLLLFSTAVAGAAPRVAGSQTVVDNGDPSNRYDIVFVGDGYTEAEQAVFREHVDAAVQKLRATAPYTRYWSFVNVHRVDVVSRDSGFTDRVENVVRETAFGVSIGERGAGFITGNQGAINRVVARHAPDADAIVCLINKGTSGVSYGKICFSRPSPSTVVHELGHTIGRLADEYTEYGELNIPRPLVNLLEGVARPILNLVGWNFSNVTSHTQRSRIPWKHWIDDGTPLPSPEGTGKPGLYQGAFYFTDRFYRPQERCVMKGSGSFCVACREQLVLSLAKKVVPYRWTSRQTPAGVQLGCQPLVRSSLRARWFLGNRQVATGTSYVVPTSAVQGLFGARVRLELQDATPWVRRDARQTLVTSHDWTLRRRGAAAVVQSQASNQHRSLVGALLFRLQGNWSRTRSPSRTRSRPRTRAAAAGRRGRRGASESRRSTRRSAPRARRSARARR